MVAAESLQRFHEELARIALEYAVVLNTLRDGVVSLDARGRVVMVNVGAARLLGRTADELRGERVHRLVHGAWVPEEGCGFCEALQRGLPASAEETVARRDGSTVHLACQALPVWKQDRRMGTVLVLRDLSAEFQAEHRGREAARLKDEAQRGREVLNTLAHEMNNHLTPILLQARLLRRKAERAGAAEGPGWDILERNVEHLAAMMGDLLEAGRLEAGQPNLRRDPFDLAELAEQTAGLFATAAAQAGVALRVAAPAPVRAQGDAARLRRVLTNLVGNALKFTPRGGHVALEVRARDGWAEVVVRDDGAGIAPEDLPRLFQPFWQSASAAPRGAGAHAGAGLGLHIARGIVEAHGGRIWAESAGPGRGAAFVVQLPEVWVTPAAPAPALLERR